MKNSDFNVEFKDKQTSYSRAKVLLEICLFMYDKLNKINMQTKKTKPDKLKKQLSKQKPTSAETSVLQEMFFKSKLWKQHFGNNICLKSQGWK